jgi:hypothetical protein
MAVSFLTVVQQNHILGNLFPKQNSLVISKLHTNPTLLSDKDQIQHLKTLMRLVEAKSLYLLLKGLRTPT